MDFIMEHQFNEEKGCWDVMLSGEVDIFNSTELKTKLTEVLSQKAAPLHLHCQRLEFIDSTALGALVGVMKTVKSNGREMHLVSVKPNIMKLFRITNLDKVFIMEEGTHA